eukprot:3485516-Rhodomonas_salina.2
MVAGSSKKAVFKVEDLNPSPPAEVMVTVSLNKLWQDHAQLLPEPPSLAPFSLEPLAPIYRPREETN